MVKYMYLLTYVIDIPHDRSVAELDNESVWQTRGHEINSSACQVLHHDTSNTVVGNKIIGRLFVALECSSFKK